MISTKQMLVAEVFINGTIEKVWDLWTNPLHIANWNNMSDDWHTPRAENDLRVGGKLYLRMETKDGKSGFDYQCIYDEIIINKKITHTTSDDRKTTVVFSQRDHGVQLTETFEPEGHTPVDIQQAFCQSILVNFKNYVEGQTPR